MQNSIHNAGQLSATDRQSYEKQCRQNKLSVLKETLNFLKDDDQYILTWPKVTTEDENLLSSLLYRAKPIESYNSHENSIYCIAIYEVVKDKSKDFVFNIHIENTESVFKSLTIRKTDKLVEEEEVLLVQDHPDECIVPVPKQKQITKVTEIRVNKEMERRNKDLNKAFAVPVNATKAVRMMKLMGWDGGALGKTGDGIVDPIMPYLNATPGIGLGCNPKDKKNTKTGNTNNNMIIKNSLDDIRLQFLTHMVMLYERESINMIEMKPGRQLTKKEVTVLKKICTVFNTQEGLNIFTDGELDKVVTIQRLRNNQDVKISHIAGPLKRKSIFLRKEMPKACPTGNSSTDVSQTKQHIKDFETFFTTAVLSFIQNYVSSHILVIKTDLTKKVAVSALRVTKKCNNGHIYEKDSPALVKAIQLAQTNNNQLILLQFEPNKRHIQLNKIIKSPSSKDVQIFDSICRDNDLAFRTDLYKIILSVLKDEIPQRYIDLLSVITEPEAHTLEDIVKSLNSRQRPVSPLPSHKQILMVDEILQKLCGNTYIYLVLDISVNRQYLRITKQFKPPTLSSFPVVELNSQDFDSFKLDMFNVFIDFFKNDEKTFILKFKTTPLANMERHYDKLKMFLTNRKPIIGIGKDIEILNLYAKLQKVVFSGPDLGIVHKISSDKRSITITKEPRFMTEAKMTKNNKQSRNVSDESDDDETNGTTDTGTACTGTTCTETTDTGTLDTAATTSEISQDNISITFEDTLYQLRNNTIENIKTFLYSEKFSLSINTKNDKLLEKFAQQIKFLVTLECFLRESWKVKLNLLTENGFLVETSFSNAVIKNFNLGTKCSFTKNEILSNLFHRLLKHDYCNLKTENQLRQISITKIIKKVTKKTNEKSSTILNIDDDISIIEEKIETVDLTEDNVKNNKNTPTNMLYKSIKVNESENIKEQLNNDVVFITNKKVKNQVSNINNDNIVNLVDNDLDLSVDGLSESEEDVVFLPNDDYVSRNKYGFSFLEALTKRDYSLLYVPYGKMFNGITCSNSNESMGNNNYVKRIRNRKWYPKENQSIFNSQLNINDDIPYTEIRDLTRSKYLTSPNEQNNQCTTKDIVVTDKLLENDQDVTEDTVMAVYDIIANTFERLAKKDSKPPIQQDQAELLNENIANNEERKTEVIPYNQEELTNEFISNNIVAMAEDNTLITKDTLTNDEVKLIEEFEVKSQIDNKDESSAIKTTNANDKTSVNVEINIIDEHIIVKDYISDDLPIDVDEFDKDEVIFIEDTGNDKESIIEIDSLAENSILLTNETIDLDEYVDKDPVIFVSNYIDCNEESIDKVKVISSDNASLVTNDKEDSLAQDLLKGNKEYIDYDEYISKDPELYVDEPISNEIKCMAKESGMNYIHIENNNTSDKLAEEIDKPINSNESMSTSQLFNKSDFLFHSIDNSEIFTKDGSTSIEKSKIDNKAFDNSEVKGDQSMLLDNTPMGKTIQNTDSIVVTFVQTPNNQLIDDAGENQCIAMDIAEGTMKSPCPLAASKRFHSESLLNNLNKKFKQITYLSKKFEIRFFKDKYKIDDAIASKIQMEILNQIDSTQFVPMLKCLNLNNGKLVYKIKDESSYNWFETVISNFRINGECLQLVIDDAAEEKYSVVMRFNSFIEEPCEVVLNRITQFNKEIETTSWVILNKFSFASTNFIYLEIDSESFVTLRDLNFCLNLGIDIAYFDKVY